MPAYTPVPEAKEEAPLSSGAGSNSPGLAAWAAKHRIPIAVVTLALTFLLGFSAGSSPSPAATYGASTGGSSGVRRDCGFEECERGSCDAASSPYLCLDTATAYMGCSGADWGAYCSDSCTMANCADTVAPKNLESCAGVKCAAEKCDPASHYQRCGADAPYQCTGGSSANGCSSDSFGWVLTTATTCSGCCDSTAC